jgi:hypothetical protein
MMKQYKTTLKSVTLYNYDETNAMYSRGKAVCRCLARLSFSSPTDFAHRMYNIQHVSVVRNGRAYQWDDVTIRLEVCLSGRYDERTVVQNHAAEDATATFVKIIAYHHGDPLPTNLVMAFGTLIAEAPGIENRLALAASSSKTHSKGKPPHTKHTPKKTKGSTPAKRSNASKQESSNPSLCRPLPLPPLLPSRPGQRHPTILHRIHFNCPGHRVSLFLHIVLYIG